MALMDMFKKKSPDLTPLSMQMPLPQQSSVSPADFVISLRQQGLSDDQIIQTLQRQGYDANTIFDAVSLADSKVQMTPAVSESMVSQPSQQMDTHSFEEIAESIVNEKWKEFQETVKKIADWRDAAQLRIERLESSHKDMKSDVENLHTAIVAKIGDFDRSLLDVGTEIKAMEKVFQKILPEFTSNVQELSRVTKSMRGRKDSGQ